MTLDSRPPLGQNDKRIHANYRVFPFFLPGILLAGTLWPATPSGSAADRVSIPFVAASTPRRT